jgi:hypothetical protein
VNYAPIHTLFDAIQGATIASGQVTDEEGLHINFMDGRILVILNIRGTICLSLMAPVEKLH